MVNFVFTNAKEQLLLGTWSYATADMRVLLVDSSTTADTESDTATINAFTTLGELSGTNYSAGGVALSGEAVAEDAANDRGEFDASDATWSSINAGTAAGALLYFFSNSVTESIPVAWIDTGGFPITTNGGDLTISWNAEGILQAT